MNGFALKTRPAPATNGAAAPRSRISALTFVIILFGAALFLQSAIVVQARPQDLITGAHGIADILHRSFPPDFAGLPGALWPALETIDMGLFGTAIAVIFAVPLALCRRPQYDAGKAVLFPGPRLHRAGARRAGSDLGAHLRHRGRPRPLSRRACHRHP